MENIKESLRMYVEHRIPTGGFLEAVLKNDLFGAYSRADLENTKRMQEIVVYIYNHIPIECYGSAEKVYRWLSEK